ncbi:MAG: divergent polysaccharide deacetylase family protein [Rhodospirillales bacterium]|nr:divergent polysaccharide deacetylase family protein [Rhodospirillales bacterium]MDE2576229.1 divergent polysaccharide deacetylase family protein [Rhodospirillales bacterium]
MNFLTPFARSALPLLALLCLGAQAARAQSPATAPALLSQSPIAAPAPMLAAPLAPALVPFAPPAPLPPVAGPAPAAPELPAWQRFAVAAPPADGRPTISFMFDDMGLNRPESARAAALPGPLTLSWMPYAEDLARQVADGRAHGHETMLHMPMEPLGHTDPGPHALRTWLSASTNLAYLRAALDSVPGAVGLNQHEASVASLSVPLMDLVMGELHARGMLFVDSVTIPHSVALARARAAGLPAVARDVFLDNSSDPAAIRAQIAVTESIARRYGHAIAIGHPRINTVDVLAQYLPTVAARGFVLWPVSATVAAQNRIVVSAAPAVTPR